MAEETPKKRSSKIKKSIERVFNIAKYETLRVSVGIEEEVQWDSMAERMSKSKACTSVLLDDFNKTVREAFENLKLAEDKAFLKTTEQDAIPVVVHSSPNDITETELTNFDVLPELKKNG